MIPTGSRLVQVIAPHFVAGFEIDEDNIVRGPAPIIGYMTGWSASKATLYIKNKGWTLATVGRVRSNEPKIRPLRIRPGYKVK